MTGTLPKYSKSQSSPGTEKSKMAKYSPLFNFKELGSCLKSKTSGRIPDPITPPPLPQLGPRFHRLQEGNGGGTARQKQSHVWRDPPVARASQLQGLDPSLHLHKAGTDLGTCATLGHPSQHLHKDIFLSSQVMPPGHLA